MSVVNALANFCVSSEIQGSGDTGRGRVEHRSFISCCSLNIFRVDQIQAWSGNQFGVILSRRSGAEGEI